MSSSTADGYRPPDQGAVDAVRAVVSEALDRDGDWSGLAAAGLLALPVPEAYGGEGLDLAEVGVLTPGLREVGGRIADRPEASARSGGRWSTRFRRPRRRTCWSRPVPGCRRAG